MQKMVIYYTTGFNFKEINEYLEDGWNVKESTVLSGDINGNTQNQIVFILEKFTRKEKLEHLEDLEKLNKE